MSWKLDIEKVGNGYILTGKFGDSDMRTRLVVAEPEDVVDENEREQTMMESVLREVQEYFAVYNSKHNKTRLNIEVVKN